jgi:NAD(P)-dependent dehydrogenase (short-subunit alcohol dehydrogenase family)
MKLLHGKTAIVTGAGGGLGRCHALAMAREGANIVVNDLGSSRDGLGATSEMADKVVEEIRAMGGQAVANYDNVATMAGAQAVVQTAVDAFGRVDILVNNAGILRDKSLLKMEEAFWDAVIAVHLKGTFAMTQAAGRRMAEQGQGGRIINTSSTSGLIGNFGQANYGAAKAGIAGFTRVAAIELNKFGIQVNAIVPIAKTRMTAEITQVPDELSPERVSPLVVYLASELSQGITGRIFGSQGLEIKEYKYHITPGATATGDIWTAEEIAARFADIVKE